MDDGVLLLMQQACRTDDATTTESLNDARAESIIRWREPAAAHWDHAKADESSEVCHSPQSVGASLPLRETY